MHEEYNSVGDREREEPSTPILETLAVAYRCKTEETVGGGEESEAKADDGAKMGIRCGKTNERGQEGQTDLGGTTTTKGEETDTEVGTTTSEGRETEHALRPACWGQGRQCGSKSNTL